MVVAPLALAKSIVASHEDPVSDGGSVAVGGSGLRAPDDLEHHRIVYHFAAVRYVFVFTNCIHHECDVVEWHPSMG